MIIYCIYYFDTIFGYNRKLYIIYFYSGERKMQDLYLYIVFVLYLDYNQINVGQCAVINLIEFVDPYSCISTFYMTT